METPAARALSARTIQTYAQDWALFTDWCAATGHPALPAGADTVLRFLADCPAARSTQRCRVAAIDHHHTAAGAVKPGECGDVRAALGRPIPESIGPLNQVPDVEAALRMLPSHGWTRGMFGRRDRCLLVLSQVAGVPYRHLATTTVGDIAFADGITTITGQAGRWSLQTHDDALLCGPCAIARWLRVVDLAVTKISTSVQKEAVGKADPLTTAAPHLCRSTRVVDVQTTGVPLFPPINQWGALPFPLQTLTPHSLSRRVRDILAGDLGAHRDLPVDQDDTTEPDRPTAIPVAERAVYSREDSQRAWARRRADIADLAGVDAILAEVDARATDLQRRTAAILVGQTNPAEPAQRNARPCPTPSPWSPTTATGSKPDAAATGAHPGSPRINNPDHDRSWPYGSPPTMSTRRPAQAADGRPPPRR